MNKAGRGDASGRRRKSGRKREASISEGKQRQRRAQINCSVGLEAKVHFTQKSFIVFDIRGIDRAVGG